MINEFDPLVFTPKDVASFELHTGSKLVSSLEFKIQLFRIFDKEIKSVLEPWI